MLHFVVILASVAAMSASVTSDHQRDLPRDLPPALPRDLPRDPPMADQRLGLRKEVYTNRRQEALVHDMEEKTKLLQDVMWALKKAIDFFAQDYSSINVDGVFGMRLAEGSIDGLLTECLSGQLACPGDLVDELRRFQDEIQRTASLAWPYLVAQDPAYMKKFEGLISSKFSLDYRPESLGQGRRVPHTNGNYDETMGDECMALILGTGSLQDVPQPVCTVTKKCYDYMSRPDMDNYVITHQLIYFMFIDMNDCVEQARKIDTNNDPDFMRSRERELCNNILGEAKEEAGSGQVAMLKQDLFLEQTVLCGMLGFTDLFAPAYIRMTLSWQYPSGCFSIAPRLIEEGLNKQENLRRRSELLAALQREAHLIDQAPPPVTGRKLMRETAMEGNCLAHKTGLAAGTLGAYLRYLAEVIYTA